jgi:hypothetical protein
VLPEATSSYDADPRKLRAHADDRAAKGDYLTAVRLLFRAAIIERALCEGSLTRTADAAAFRQARTYRELTQEFARTGEEVAELDRLAHRLEAGVYGGAEMVAADWARARALLARISHQVTS